MLLNQKKREKLGSNSFRVTRQDELLPSVLKTVRRAYSSYVSIKIGQLLLKSAKEQRIAAESVEEREGRLQLVRTNRDRRIASESSSQREVRLQRDSTNQQLRIACETPQETEA